MFRKICLTSLFFVVFLSGTTVAFADRPLVTEDTDILTAGDIELKAGVEYLANPGIPFSARRVNGGFIKLPALGLNIGLGKLVELQADFDMVYLDQHRIEKTYDNGDLRLWTKIKVKQEDSSFPSLGVRIGTKLPNADTDNRGTNETDFFILMLFSRHFDDLYAHLNLGLGILGDPNQRASQDDVMVYAAALEMPLKSVPMKLVAEVYGQAFSNGRHNNISSAKCGIQYEITDDFVWDLFGTGGLTNDSEDWSAGTGFTYRFQAFELH